MCTKISQWELSDFNLPKNLNKLDKIENPYNIIPGVTLFFYAKPIQKICIGVFYKTYFVAFNDSGEIINKYTVNEVPCWIYASNVIKLPIDNDISNEIICSPHSLFLYFDKQQKLVKTDDDFAITDYENTDYEYIAVLSEIPKFVDTFIHETENYRWRFLDDKDGVYTYNIDKKTWFGWMCIKSISITNQKDAYDYSEELLNILNKKF